MSDYAAAWLAEMWPTCREESRLVRIDKRNDDRREQWEMEERRLTQDSPRISPGCAESGAADAPPERQE